MRITLTVLVLSVLLAGCNSGDPYVAQETEPTMAEETTADQSAIGKYERKSPVDKGKAEQGFRNIECALEKATQGMSPAEIQTYINETMAEAMQRGTDMGTILAERGYNC